MTYLDPTRGTPKPSRRLEKTRWPGVFKRGQSFVVRVTIEGRKVQRSAPTAKEAMALRDELRAARHLGTFRHETPKTLAEFSREWLDGYQGRSRTGVRPATVSEYRDDLRLHVLPALGNMRLGQIRPTHVDRLVGQLSKGTAPSPAGFKRRPLSAGSVQRAIAPLRAMLNDAVRLDLIATSPCTGLRLPGPRLGDRKSRALEPTETAALIAAAAEGFDRCFMQLIAEAGLRPSEALGLFWEDLELGATPELRVRRGFVKGEYGPPKSAYGRREVPLRRELASQLRRWKIASAWSGDKEPVFANLVGRPYDYSALRRRVMLTARKRAGIPDANFRALRRTATTDLLAVGVPLKQVQEWMGHHDASFTMAVYAQARRSDVPDLDALFRARDATGGRP